MTTLEQLGIDRMTAAERLQLIDRIWDSLPDAVEPGDVPEWHLIELQRRRAAAQGTPGAGRPWREVLAELQGTE